MEIQIMCFVFWPVYCHVYLFIHFCFFIKKKPIQIILPSVNDSDYSSLVYARFADPYITVRPRANICDVLGNIMNIRAANIHRVVLL